MTEHTDDRHQSALIRALRRENRRLWGEVEARQAAEHERLTHTEHPQEAALDTGSGASEATEVVELLETVVTTVSLAIHDECVALADALATRAAYTQAQSEARMRSELTEQFTVLAARLDRMNGELMSIRELLDDLREAQRLRDERAGMPRVDPAEAVWRPRTDQPLAGMENGAEARSRRRDP